MLTLPNNAIKQRLARGERMIGFWLTLGNPAIAEIASEAGFDWVLIDMEHGDNLVPEVAHQLRAVMRGGAEAGVRVPGIDPALVKRLLDLGARTLMFPNVRTADEARAAVAATRYPPHGTRGMAGTSRGPGYGRIPGYFASAHEQICVVLQIETRAGLDAAAEIAAVEGVDCLFIGPSDLSADLGVIGDTGHDLVQAAIREALAVIRASGKASGILEFNGERARSLLASGYQLVAVAGDANVLARETLAIAKAFAEPSAGSA